MASTNKLYPPILNGVIPAFYKRSKKTGDSDTWKIIEIAIPFAMNKMVLENNVLSMCLRLKTVQTNEVVYFGTCGRNRFDLKQGIAYFDIYQDDTATENIADKIQEGLFYKAQLAYCEDLPDAVTNASQAGYFSTVGITKCIAKPDVSIAGYDAGKVNLYNTRIVGHYEQDIDKGDSNEKVYSYSFTITDRDNNVYLTSGVQLHNVNNDINHWESTDEFLTNKELVDGELYYIQYKVTTVNGLDLSSPTYRIMAGESIAMEKPIQVLPELNYDEGYIQINFKGPFRYVLNEVNQELEMLPEDYCSGFYLLSRGYIKDDYMVWEDIARFKLDNVKPSTHYERDFTIEQGVTYQYRLQQYNKYEVYSQPIYSQEIYADFEDMFLYDGVRQLKVRFNPKVSSFKVNIPEQKLETIGSKYPFIFRNGNVYYHEFPISGLISYQLDEAKLFLNADEIIDGNLLEKNYFYKTPNFNEVGTAFNYNLNSPDLKYGYQTYPTNNIRMGKDLTSENLMSERYFKLAVLEWLTNGEIKLFRSPGEGNYLVRLLNTSLTPNDTLGRMLHTFNTTAYEIADLTYDNLLGYELIKVVEPDHMTIQTGTIEITENNQVLYDNTLSDQPDLFGIDVSDCMPGDQLIIEYMDSATPETITIGVTGSYTYSPIERKIKKITFVRCPDNDFDYPRIVTLSYPGESQQRFDLIESVKTDTIIGRVYYGPNADLVNSVSNAADNYFKFNIQIGSSDMAYKTKLLNMEMLRVKAREIIPLYRWQENNNFVYSVTPFGVGYPLKELKALTNTEPYYIRNQIVSSFAIYKIYEKQENNTYVKPNATAHLVNELQIENSDKTALVTTNEEADHQYNEMYPDWQFACYWDANSDQIISDNENKGPDMRFSISSNVETGDFEYVDLTEQKEITLWNLGIIDHLWLGNGVTAETVMRIRITDYDLETTNTSVKIAKQAYLSAKKTLKTKYEEYFADYERASAAYNLYLQKKAEYDAVQEQKQILHDSLEALAAFLSDDGAEQEQINQATAAAITAINKYKNDYYIILQNCNPDYKPLSWSIPEKPADIANITGVENLLTALNIFQKFYLNTLNDYNAAIPSIDDFMSLFPEGWDIEWNANNKTTIIRTITNSLLEKLQEMYTLLRKVEGVSNIYTSTYFSDRNLPTTDQWTQAQGDTVLTDQETVCGIESLTYEDIFPNTLYHNNSEIIQAYVDYLVAKDRQDAAIEATATALSNLNVAQAAYNTAYAPIAQYDADIAEQDTLYAAEVNKIAIAEQLIEGLKSEPQSEANDAALAFLRASIVVSENRKGQIKNIINQLKFDKNEYTTNPDGVYQHALAELNSKQSAYNDAQRVETQATSAANAAFEAINNKINLWNSDLSAVKTYITMLIQIDSLLAMDLQSIAANINNLHQHYENVLLPQHTTMYNKAYAAIQEISSLSLAFAQLTELQTTWQTQYDYLNSLPSPRNPGQPTPFAWDTYLTNIKNTWIAFIQELTIAYQQFETRYY